MKSVWRRQIILVIIAPTIAKAEKKFLRRAHLSGNKIIIRIRPYPPSFRSTAARIIEPATGASTWAFGSHRWTENSGSFTRNASIISSLTKYGFISVGIDIHG